MKFDDYLDRFNELRNMRKVLTNSEVRAAAMEGVKPVTLAQTNDDLCAEYDAALAEQMGEVPFGV